MQVKKHQLEWDMEHGLVPNWERSRSRLYIVTLLIYLYAEHIKWNARLDEVHGEIKLLGEISIISNTQMIPPLWQKAKKELKSLLMKVKKLAWNFQKTKIRASSPITSWQIVGKTTDTVTDFIFLGSKISADGDYSHEINRHLLLGRKAMTSIDSILKSRDTTLLAKFHLVRAMVFQLSCMDVRVGL